MPHSSNFLLLLIYSSAFCISSHRAFVITKYDKETLATYFQCLYNNNHHHHRHPSSASDNVQDHGQSMTDRNLIQYCHQLRQSRVFRSEKNKSRIPDSQNALNEHHVDSPILEIERDQSQMYTTTLQIKKLSVNLNLISLKCSDLDGNFLWYVTPFSIPAATFLFTVDVTRGGFNHAFVQQIHRQLTVKPHLAAIIDNSATQVTSSYASQSEELRTRFSRSIKSAGSNNRDALCDQHQMIKFRLCAIAADKISEPINEPMGDVISAQSYWEQVTNFYYEPNTSDEQCPLVAMGDFNATRRLLSCSTYIVDNNNTSHYYLSLNTVDPSKLFVVRTLPFFTTTFTILREQQIPLLEHLDAYDEALRNC